MIQARMIFNDPVGRWKKGEIGQAIRLPVTHKYDYQVDLGTVPIPPGESSFGETQHARIYFMYALEIEVLEEKQ